MGNRPNIERMGGKECMTLDIETYSPDRRNIFNGKVISIGCQFNHSEPEVYCEWKSSEKQIIHEVIDRFDYEPNIFIMGFNIQHFDIPFLINRGIINYLGDYGYIEKVFNFPVDLMTLMLPYNDYIFKGLKATDISRKLGFKCFPDDYVNGSEIQKLYDNREYDKIKEHNIADINFNIELFNWIMERKTDYKLGDKYE